MVFRKQMSNYDSTFVYQEDGPIIIYPYCVYGDYCHNLIKNSL